MRERLQYKDHSIVVERGLYGCRLLIDGKQSDKKNGAFAAQLLDYDLCGTIQSPDGAVEAVRVEIRAGWFRDSVVFYCGEKEIDARQVRA